MVQSIVMAGGRVGNQRLLKRFFWRRVDVNNLDCTREEMMNHVKVKSGLLCVYKSGKWPARNASN